ncbi:hypothetical protein A3Q56_07512, partial [Intoshia linei]
MASFIAKQLVGDKLDSVKGVIGGGDDKDDKGNTSEDERELEKQRQELEEKRAEKHRQIEKEREVMRQEIRNKYGLKKKEEPIFEEILDDRIGGRKRKTPEELERENSLDDDDNFFPKNFNDIKAKITNVPQNVTKMVDECKDKCSI